MTSLQKEKGKMPFFVEFVKFAAGFFAIIALALLTLRLVDISTP